MSLSQARPVAMSSLCQPKQPVPPRLSDEAECAGQVASTPAARGLSAVGRTVPTTAARESDRLMNASQPDDADRNLDFDALVAKYEKKIFNVIYRFLGDYEEATDLTQETF